MNPPRILIVRLSALGDAALTLPLYFRLRAFFPTAFIGWVIEERHAGLLAAVPGLDRVHLWRREEKNWRGARRLAREIKSENYDIALDAQGLTKSAILPWLAGIKRRIGFRRAPLEARELAPWLDNELVAPPPALTHIAARTNELAAPFVPAEFTAPVKFHFPDADRQAIGAWRAELATDKPLLLCGVGTSWETKMLPPEYVAALLRAARGWQPVVVWGPDEAAKIAAWRKIFGDAVKWAPRTENVAQLIVLLNYATAYVGPDSAPLHLAWLLNKPTFSWFGPSSADRGAPPTKNDRHIVAHPPTRQRRGAMMWDLKPERVLPEFAEWLRAINDAPSPANLLPKVNTTE
ncbi:glycosyl transferase [Planctomycetales bacterium]|nr:glycosyl transferase [Planctomycetales bacterium]GHT01578.1 glycosyl transferase [Planctomycetales bacterium]GHT08886.1 glycosyl transferase [Planctomycetales bacterium]